MIGKFLKAIWNEPLGQYAELRTSRGGVFASHFFHLDSKTLGMINAFLTPERLLTEDVYFGVLPRLVMSGGTPQLHTRWLWADVDKKRGKDFSSLLYGAIPPNIIVDSGHGWHLYWQLDAKVSTSLAQRAMKQLASDLGGDAVGDASRILRLPGTLNHKNPEEPLPVRIIRMDTETVHRWSDFDLPDEGRRSRYSAEPSESWTPSSEEAPIFGEGMRNSGLVRLAGAMVHKGMTPDEIQHALWAENMIRCRPPLDEREVLQIVESVLRYRA